MFALDAREPRDGACAGTGYFSNADLPVWPLGPTVVRSPALGRIRGKHPSVAILPRARLRHGRLYVARVRCPAACQVSYEVSDPEQGTPFLAARFLGTRLLSVKPSGLRHGTLTVRMHLDDSPAIIGTTRYAG